MDILTDVRLACARVYSTEKNHSTGSAFLISSRYAITAAHVVENSTMVVLDFPSGKYEAHVEAIDKKADCAVLLLDKPVEDVSPLTLGVDVKFGDFGIFFGFSSALEGTGIGFEGKVQDITRPNDEDEKYSSILLILSQELGSDIFNGYSGAPLLVGGTVVGLLTSRHTSGFLIFTRIQAALDLLPSEILQRIRPKSSPKDTLKKTGKPEIVVVTALEEELDYLYDLLPNWSDLETPDGRVSYRRAPFSNEMDIVATSARNMGLVTTAILTAKVLKEWNPSIIAMIGLCGGRKEKGLNIGDIVVANTCFHYQFGAYESGKISRELRSENTEQPVLDIVEHLVRRTDTVDKVRGTLKRGFKKPNTMLQCHIGPMASADLVVKDVEKFGEAIDADRKTIAVDMESYAFMKAAKLAGTRWSFVVKSVSDFADAKKDDEFREYAKYTSAKFSLAIIAGLVEGLNIVNK